MKWTKRQDEANRERSEEEVSRIRQEIIDKARTNLALKERERRIERKRQAEILQARLAPQPNPEQYQISPFRFNMPPLMMKLIIFNCVAWAGILFANGGRSESVVALALSPVIIIFMFIQWMIVYIVSKFYWWLAGVGWLLITVGTIGMLVFSVLEMLR